MTPRKFTKASILLIIALLSAALYWFFTADYEIRYHKGIDDRYWSTSAISQYLIHAEVTQYNPDPAQTDDTPLITASGKLISEKTAACPEWLAFGTKIRIDGKEYVCEDRMALRYRTGNYFDLANMDSYHGAIAFGRQQKVVEIIK